MHRYKNIVIIGTSHIAIQSIKEVEKRIEEEQPKVVALELDAARFQALHSKEKRGIKIRDIRKIGVKGWIFALIGEFVEKKLGNRVGVSPGAEMLHAAKVAHKNKMHIALIDQRIDITLKNFSKELTWKEKFRFLGELVSAPFSKKKIKFDLRKVPEDKIIEEMVGHVKKRYPSVYKVLIEDRNKYMARQLYRLMPHFEKIVAVVGAGHGKEIIEEIKKLESRSTSS